MHVIHRRYFFIYGSLNISTVLLAIAGFDFLACAVALNKKTYQPDRITVQMSHRYFFACGGELGINNKRVNQARVNPGICGWVGPRRLCSDPHPPILVQFRTFWQLHGISEEDRLTSTGKSYVPLLLMPSRPTH